MADRLRAAVLGATGLVGQRFVSLLARHPWFSLEAVTASERRVGKRYGEAVEWYIDEPFPDEAAELELRPTRPEAVRDADVVFVALPKEVAAGIEPELARMGKIVVSNASVYRMEPDVPLLNPEANWEHIQLVKVQRQRRGWSGAILKVPNCTTAVLTLSLKPLLDRYGLEEVYMTSMQAISGAGFAGVPGYAIVDNIIPFIKGEEEKVVRESRKILGRLEAGEVRPAGFRVVATATRVPVLDGHLESVVARLSKAPGGVEEVVEAWEGWRSLPQELGLPTAPERPIVVRREPDRPQPRLDRRTGRGMSVVVGRASLPLEGEPLLRYLVLGHNTLRGAAGTGVLIAELYYKLVEQVF
ncbi:aspartate-semialdehyde dehydrogenase [Pyrodictium occultum]|uniref:Aspartate-semialdehyde dehydrogenase n=1 Tax=Pyrodictium occultum TaxID=2309 RepID=A0A0V8RU66_PYROC|nr:aspartate-semialdehyde dehydrogenase [Pyrodictium occultum]KSW11609.1 aspartate-semialdehyde dehydrogenase [Pyrodictium occultum]